MQGILDFERKHNIPEGWVNYAIRYASPKGFWQRLEKGEINMDVNFFEGFTDDLHNWDAWKEYHSTFRSEKKKLKHIANPTQLGDHVSLKAEAAESEPTDQDRGARLTPISPSGSKATQQSENGPKPSLSKLAKDTTIGDPISLESEEVVDSSVESSGGSQSPARQRNATPLASLRNSSEPPMPKVDGEALFWAMMSASRHPDPYIFPALERLTKQKPRPVIGALSNTVIFPPGHPWRQQDRSPSPGNQGPNAFNFNPKDFFDVYIASAEVGMRKPSSEIYKLTLRQLDEADRKQGGQGINPEDVIFLDDIGENCKAGREVGMRTIKVQFGKTWRAVKELENILGDGVELMDDRTRRSKL